MASTETEAFREGLECKWIPAESRSVYDDAVAKSVKSTKLDNQNRRTLQTWVDGKAPEPTAGLDTQAGWQQAGKRATYAGKAASKFASMQRVRQQAKARATAAADAAAAGTEADIPMTLSFGAKGMANSGGDEAEGSVDPQHFVPPGIFVGLSGEDQGRVLVATRDFTAWDMALVDDCVSTVEGIPPLTDISDSSQITKLWGAEFEAFSSADGLTRRRLLELYAAATEPTLAGRLAAFADRASKGAFAKQDGAEHAGMVPRIFRGNAVQTGTGQVVLPLLGSLASHSCNPNTTRIIAPGGATCEYVCTQAVKQGDQLTCSYIGHSVRPTVARQALLKATKGILCQCARCTGPDREAALPCIICKPLVDRRWPADAGDGECGYMSRVPEQGKRSDDERWICSKDPKHVAMTSALKAIKMPEGSPAPTYLELLDYAAQIGDGLAGISLEDTLGDEATQAEQAMKFSVGHRHWATYARSVQLVRGAATKTPPPAKLLAEAAPALCNWISDWLGLLPALYVGPIPIAASADIIASSGVKDAKRIAAYLYSTVLNGVPRDSDVFEKTAAKLGKL